MFYPGMGYSWASAYPWGWLPYHYGSWAYIKGTGWAWLPGSQYSGQWYASNFRSIPTVRKAPAGWTAATPPAINTATNSARPTVVVGKQEAFPAYVPGGRIPPNFGSVIPGRIGGKNSAIHGFTSPSAGSATANRDTLAVADSRVTAARHNASAHVFAAPAPPAVSSGLADLGPSYGSGAPLRGAPPGIASSSAAGAHASSSVSSHGSSNSSK
jgi:hypothetical protein